MTQKDWDLLKKQIGPHIWTGTDLFKADDVAVGPPDSIQNIEQLAKSEEPKNEIVQQNTPSNAELIAKVETLEAEIEALKNA